MSKSYKDAGVDIDAGETLIKRIAPAAKSTARPGADASLGGFGGLFDLAKCGFQDPILVAGADGVGTKLLLAQEFDALEAIGIDLVAMCTNDVLAQGAAPLFFLDYFATGKLDVDLAARVVNGIADGCRQSGCALIGGETAEMPGLYQPSEFDLAGFCVGAVERANRWPRPTEIGDVLIGLKSSGPHANGFSLIRKIISDHQLRLNEPAPFDSTTSLGEALLAPTKIYVESVLPLVENEQVRGFAHITGGGLTDNVPRVLQGGQTPRLDPVAVKPSPLFQWLAEVGSIPEADLMRTFNCGIGGVVICAAQEVEAVLSALKASGDHAFVIGDIGAAE
ncbi:MAG: phosphoribosylformylglycinamidine cyclo-ligase [Pseudomonadota bacterium]